jgi:ATP-dependent Lon protease
MSEGNHNDCDGGDGGRRSSRRGKRSSSSRDDDNSAVADYSTEEMRFYRNRDRDVRRKIADTENMIRTLNNDDTPLRFKVLLSELDDPVKAMAMKKVNSLAGMDSGSSYQKVLQWVEALCRLPIGKYNALPIGPDAPRADIGAFLKGLRATLDERVYGHEDAKGHVVRLLAQWITTPAAKGLVIGLHGPPGVGKTELCKVVCEVIGMPFAFVPLGGANDGCYIDGHSYTYEGATWGKIADVLMKNGCMNPVLFFDELDKVSDTSRGREIINLLVHLTDSTQNDRFNDKYFLDVELDLSKCLVIFSYNDESKLNPILRDRITRVETEGYSTKDKVEIARKHLLPGMLAQFTMDRPLRLNDAVIRYVVESVEAEKGVRNLKRALHDVVSNMHFEQLMAHLPPREKADAADKEEKEQQGAIVVTAEHVDRYVKTARRDKISKETLLSMYS